MHFHMPTEFDAVEPAIRASFRKRVSRGHVQVQVYFKRNADGALAHARLINEPLLAAWLESFRDIADALPSRFAAGPEPGSADARHDRIAQTGSDGRESLEAEALAAAAEAVNELDAFRVREGEAIETEIRRALQLCGLVGQMEEIRTPRAAHLSRSACANGWPNFSNGARSNPRGWPRKRRSSPSAATSAKNWSA